MDIHKLEKESLQFFDYDVKSQLQRFIYRRSEEALAKGDDARDSLNAIEDLNKRQQEMRAKFLNAIGGLPSSDTPLYPQYLGAVQEDGYRIEKIIFESRPKTFVTSNLYVPDGIVAPRGAVIFLCGHSIGAKQAEEYQIVCRHLVKSGLVVLIQDPIGQGERFSYYEEAIKGTTVNSGIYEHDYAGSQCLPLGQSIARYFVHDAMRSMDYLSSRPEVDPNRIGVTGSSSGGAQTALLMICDPRIAAAAPCTFITDKQSYMYSGRPQDAEQVWPDMLHYGFDHEDILLLMAPRPVCVLAAKYDFIPIEGTRRTVERAKRIYEMAGKPDNCRLVEDTCGHNYTQNLAIAASEFFSEHLLGRIVTPDSDKIKAIPPSLLLCTKPGQIKADIDDARFVFDENKDRLAHLQKKRVVISDEQRKSIALGWLRERINAHRKYAFDLNPRICSIGQCDDLSVEKSFWVSQEGLFNHAFLFRDFKQNGQDLPVTIAVWSGGTNSLKEHYKWIHDTCMSGRAVMVLETSGVGSIAPHKTTGDYEETAFYGVIHKLSDDLIWLNDSIAAMRGYDILRAVDMARIWTGLRKDDLRFYAYGRHGAYALIAAAIDARVKKVECVDMESYAQWVGSKNYDCEDIRSIVMPGSLEYFDLPDLERWINER